MTWAGPETRSPAGFTRCCGLVPGGVGKEITASHAARLLAAAEPSGPAEIARWQLASDFLEDLRRFDEQMKQAKKKLAAAVKASGATLTEIFGVGPVVAAVVLGEAEDVARFRDRDRFAAYNGTAPIEVSSGRRKVYRLSRRGNRRVNHAIHMAAITQIRYAHSEGRAYYEKKVAEGKTSEEALRALKRRISDALYRRLRADARRSAIGSAPVMGPGGQAGNGTDARAPALTPNAGSSAQPLPDLSPPYALPPPHSRKSAAHKPQKRSPEPLDTQIWMALRAVAGVMRMGRARGPLTPVPFGCARPSQRLALELSFRVSPVASRTRVSVS